MQDTIQAGPPVAMTIAGSDCSSGAGLQADLKTFQHFGVHGLTAVTCVVSETANVVRGVHPVPAEFVADQVALLLDSFPVAAVKTGMLYSREIVLAVARVLAARPEVLLVVDPVMVASTGVSLLEEGAVRAYREELLPRATLITPNVPEAEVLLGARIGRVEDMESAARALAEMFGTGVLLKGGHINGPECVDLLWDAGAAHRYSSPRLAVAGSHGTGCTLSAAVTAGLAKGYAMRDAVAAAKAYLDRTLAMSYGWTGPTGATLHALNQGTGFVRK
jgi:hydroxymethylpyrimidine/phosphomethylpyrimidine kinase